MITFPRAVAVAPGEAIKSWQMASLGRAINARPRSGLGDPTWRIVFYFLGGLFRQMRNSSWDGLSYPPQDEYFQIYQFLESGIAGWPEGGPGEPEGANLSNMLNAYVFGDPSITSEESRLTGDYGIPVELDNGKPATARDYWLLAKYQRGAIDPATGAYSSPAFTAARSYAYIRRGIGSAHGNSFGGYAPSAPVDWDNWCPPPDDGSPTPPNLLIKFTPLKPDLSEVTFPGTCKDGTDNMGPHTYPTHVAYLVYTPWEYVIVQNDGTVTVLSKEDYIEGPYTGGAQLTKQSSDALGRVINAYIREFRGTAAQMAAENYHVDNAFDIQKFLTSHYNLAPAIGELCGDGTMITPVYPMFEWSGDYVAPGTLGYCRNSNLYTSRFRVNAGFVCTSIYIEGAGLRAGLSIEVISRPGTGGEDTVEQTIPLSPQDGRVEQISVFHRGIGGDIGLRVAGGMNIIAGGFLRAELAVVMEYQPQLHDLFLLLRVGAATFSGNLDGSGTSFEFSKELGDDYWLNGAIVVANGDPGLPGTVSAINSNAVYDTARRLSQVVRIIPRRQLVGYAVEGGKSVLWFKRYGFGMVHSHVDLFDGIAPEWTATASGGIEAGIEYRALAGNITYNGQEIPEGETFTGVLGIADYEGQGSAYRTAGIIATAPPKGWTNEWMMFPTFAPYDDSSTNAFYWGSYSDYWPMLNRCLVGDIRVGASVPAKTHINLGVGDTTQGVFFPEAPSGYNYMLAQTGNAGYYYANEKVGTDSATDFAKSCQIYEPDDEVEKAEVVWEAGEEMVKLTFKSRFRHADTAPATVDRDWSTWDRALFATQPRTRENAIMEYLLHEHTGTHQCTPTTELGNSSIYGILGAPAGGACFPRFCFTKLVPIPWIDNDDIPDALDSRAVHDQLLIAELYLRAMSEGCVDENATTEVMCDFDTLSICDYTWPNICYDAFGGRWVSTLPSQVTDYTEALDTRPDRPYGYGPLPATRMCAEVFNQLVSIINKMDKFRVMLPMTVESRIATTTAQKSTHAALGMDGLPADCLGWPISMNERAPIPAEPTGFGAWIPLSFPGNVTATWLAYIAPSDQGLAASCDGSNWILEAARDRAEIRCAPQSVFAYAIPDTWADMIDTDNAIIFGRTTTTTMRHELHTVERDPDSANCTQCKHSEDAPYAAWAVPDTNLCYVFSPVEEITTACGVIPKTLEPPALSYASIYGYTYHAPHAGLDATWCRIYPMTSISVDLSDPLVMVLRVPIVDESEV